MSTTQQLHITLPANMATVVKSKVDSGEYASESEVLHDGIRMLLARDHAIERWLQDDVATAYDALKNDPSTAIPIEQVQKNIAVRREKRHAKP